MIFYQKAVFTTRNNYTIIRDIVSNSNYIGNYIFARLLNFRGSLFFIIGFSSWNKPTNFYFYIPEIQFIPQGFAICFYGRLMFFASAYLFLIRFFSIGTGFNEYNKQKEEITIFRWGFPGKNRRFKLSYSLIEIETLILENRNYIIEMNNSSLYLLMTNKQKVLLIRDSMLTVQEIEYFSSELAKFLNLPIKRNFLKKKRINFFSNLIKNYY